MCHAIYSRAVFQKYGQNDSETEPFRNMLTHKCLVVDVVILYDWKILTQPISERSGDSPRI